MPARSRLATHYLPSDRLEEAKERIMAQPFRVEAILDELAEDDVPEARIMGNLEKIDRYFASDRLEDILDALDAAPTRATNGRATEAATIRRKSADGLQGQLKLLSESPYQLHFVDEMRMEYGDHGPPDPPSRLPEGVRALLIDKDNKPNWHPPTPRRSAMRDVDAFFEPLPVEEQWRPFDF